MASKRTRDDADEGDDFECMAYGLKYLPLDVYVYIGSTGREDQRGCEHFNLASGARRVVVTFAQSWWQPLANHFRFDPLWKGKCSAAQLKAIEQHLMDKHGTRVFPRPTNGIVKDIDLFAREVVPRQLNVLRSCTDESLVDWAARHVANSMALVSLTPAQTLEIQYTMDMVRLTATEAASVTAQAIISRSREKYAHHQPLDLIPINEIQADLNAVFRASMEEDGIALRDCLFSMLQWYNADKRGAGYTMIASVVGMVFAGLAAASGGVDSLPNQARTRVVPEVQISQPEPLLQWNTIGMFGRTSNSWTSWKTSAPVWRVARSRTTSTEHAWYVDITCPLCDVVFEAPSGSNEKPNPNCKGKGAACKAHRIVCSMLTDEERRAAATDIAPSKRDRSKSAIHIDCNRRICEVESKVRELERRNETLRVDNNNLRDDNEKLRIANNRLRDGIQSS